MHLIAEQLNDMSSMENDQLEISATISEQLRYVM